MGWLLVGILSLIALDLLVRSLVVPLVLRIFEHMPAFGVYPGKSDPKAESIQFPTTDGLTLRGSLYHPEGQSPQGLILFCPELGGNHWLAMNYCGGLLDAGFAILAFDFRNQGESDALPGYEPLHWLTDHEVHDTRAALNYVQQRRDLNHLPLGLFGVSRGGCAALAGAAGCSTVKCVACDSTFTTQIMMEHYARRWGVLYVPQWVMKLLPKWHLRSTLRLVLLISQFRKRCRYAILEDELSRLAGKPVFLVAGERDSYVPLKVAKEVARQIGPSCQDLWIVPGAKHNAARQVAPQEYDRRMIAFFRQMGDSAEAGLPAPKPSERVCH